MRSMLVWRKGAVARAVVIAALPAWAALLGVGCGHPPPIDTSDAGDRGTDAGVDPCSGATDGEVPTARREMVAAYDAARERVVVFGGNTGIPEMCMPRTEITADVFAFDAACSTWSRVTPTGEGPGPRARMAIATDEAGGRVLVFGGRSRVGTTGYQNYGDVWSYDLATDAWTLVHDGTGGPSPRSSAVIALDAARERLVVFGGNSSASGLTLTGEGDLWSLDLTTGTWAELAPGGLVPGPRLYHAGAVIGGELVIFGGTPMFEPPYYDDVWALDLASDTWRQVDDGTGGPNPRFGSGLFADAERGRALVFGGHDDTDIGNENDVWAIDLATGAWSRLHDGDTLNGAPSGACMFPPDFTIPEEGSPERRYAFAQAGDGARAFVIGGTTDCGATNDVFALDLASAGWTMLRAPTTGEACNRSGRVDCTTLCY